MKMLKYVYTVLNQIAGIALLLLSVKIHLKIECWKGWWIGSHGWRVRSADEEAQHSAMRHSLISAFTVAALQKEGGVSLCEQYLPIL